MDSKRDTGARCDDAIKNKNMKLLNTIIGREYFTKENTALKRAKDGEILQEAVPNVEFCVLEEFILRYFNQIKKDGKLWFLTPEMAIYHKLYTIFI